jgi:hypothetical protein
MIHDTWKDTLKSVYALTMIIGLSISTILLTYHHGKYHNQPAPTPTPTPAPAPVVVQATNEVIVTTVLNQIGANEYHLQLYAKVPDGYRVYSINQEVGGPPATIIELSPGSNVTQTSDWLETPDPVKENNLSVFPSGIVMWEATVVTDPDVLPIVNGLITFYPCSSTCCLNPQIIPFGTDATPGP